MSGFPPPPPGTDLTANRGHELTTQQFIDYPLVVIAVLLRVISRKISGAGFWIDDYLVLLAFAFVTALFVNSTFVDNGIGQHVWTVGYDVQVYQMKLLYADELLYGVLICIIKFSILALYWRIFHISNLRLPILIVTGIVAAWGIAITFVVAFQCTPVAKVWDIALPGTCVQVHNFVLGSALPNILTDVILLILPIQGVWKLKITTEQKILVSGVFMLGGFVTIISCIRLHSLISLDLLSPDLTWTFFDTILWSQTELNIGLISACLPALAPLYKHLRSGSLLSSSKKTPRISSYEVYDGSGSKERSRTSPQKRAAAGSETQLRRTTTDEEAQWGHSAHAFASPHKELADRGSDDIAMEEVRSEKGRLNVGREPGLHAR